jgi:hypothetical protein
MEYERTEDGQIQAAFAQRAGQLLVQYDHLRKQLPPEQQFEATLAIALLQSMLTMCYELMKKYRGSKNPSNTLEGLLSMGKRTLDAEPTLLGLTKECVLERWHSEKQVSYRDVIECIRHALSHPLPQQSAGFPRTGFTTEFSGSGQVVAYVFTQSPWSNSNGSDVKPFYKPQEASKDSLEKLKKTVGEWETNNHVVGLDYVVEKGFWKVVLNGTQFIPVCRIRLDVAQLRVFTAGLSDYLSEPVRQGVAHQAQREVA